MHCLILNGNPEPGSFDGYLDSFAEGLAEAGADARTVTLRDLKLRTCTGCWDCWWKTPGVCSLKDDMEDLLRAMVATDLVIWASPLILGAPSALLKTAQDRSIPVLHPYIILHRGECHHRRRYAHNPDLGLIVAPGPGDGEEDIAIAKRLYERFSLNTRTSFRVFATTSTPIEEVVHAALVA